MKTENIPRNRTMTYNPKEKVREEPKDQTSCKIDANSKSRIELEPSKRIELEPSKRIELEKTVINNPEAVQKMIGDSIQWRDMRFYQREEGGQYYVDIVDRATGNVVRTIPDTKFAEIAEKYKQLSGLKINING